jgi:hypothetical protein
MRFVIAFAATNMRASILGAALFGAVVISCEPPPQPPTGRLVWSFACDTSVPGQTECGNAPESLIEGVTRRMPPPQLDVACFIDVQGSTASFRVSIEQTRSDGQVFGISRICGSTTSTGGIVANSKVSARFGASRINGIGPGTSTGPSCDVRVTEVTANSIKGQFRCARVQDDALQYRRINGVAPPASPSTVDPEWAEFAFSNCVTGAGSCR